MTQSVFETEDAAHIALGRIREAGLKVQSVLIRYTEPRREGGVFRETGPSLAFQFTGGALESSAFGVGMPVAYAGLAYEDREIDFGADARSREVLLEVQVPPPDVKRAENILVNAHGRQVRSC